MSERYGIAGFDLLPRLKAIHEADHPRFSDAEMARRRAAIESLLDEVGADHRV